MSDDGVEATCENCEYEWTYTGQLAYATCPSCRKKTLVETDE